MHLALCHVTPGFSYVEYGLHHSSSWITGRASVF
jgi:hypothetical protein